MKSIICPTVTAYSIAEYRQQLERIQSFARRIHLDFMDGEFAPVKSVGLEEIWWQKGPMIDFHIMYQKPLEYLETVIRMQPHLVVIHAEADNAAEFLKKMQSLGIKRGLALLQGTSVQSIAPLLPMLDHVLIFSGDLGHFGGTVDLSLLDKAKELKSLKPGLEIGWDGGIKDSNAAELAAGGVDVLNVGGYIQKAEDPEDAYDTLEAVLREG